MSPRRGAHRARRNFLLGYATGLLLLVLLSALLILNH